METLERNITLHQACRRTGLKPDEFARRAVEAKVGVIHHQPNGSMALYFNFAEVFKVCSPFWPRLPKRMRKSLPARVRSNG